MFELPEELRLRLQDVAELDQKGYSSLSAHYKKGASGYSSKEERRAYVTARMPATYAALYTVLGAIPFSEVKTVIDFGAGPGTGFWATRERFPSLHKITLIEKDREMVEIGKNLAGDTPLCEWSCADMQHLQKVPDCDLALFSYSLGEIPLQACERLLSLAWQQARWLVIVEPGTPRGYERILSSRSFLLSQGARLVAPCPHENRCPMQGTSEWCHFSVRLPRSRLHRMSKQASLGYEDEKFSYMIFSKQGPDPMKGRLVGYPQKMGGHVRLKVCASEGLRDLVVTKSQGPAYKWARKAEWGDACLEDLL